MQSFIYFAKFKERPGIKIGKADNLHRRLKTLVQYHGPIELVKYLTVPVADVLAVESSYHKKYAAHHLIFEQACDGSTEFFDITFNDLPTDLLLLGKTSTRRLNQDTHVVNSNYHTSTHQVRVPLSVDEWNEVRSFLGINNGQSLPEALANYLMSQINRFDYHQNPAYNNLKKYEATKNELKIAKIRQYQIMKQRDELKKELYDLKQSIEYQIQKELDVRLGDDYQKVMRENELLRHRIQSQEKCERETAEKVHHVFQKEKQFYNSFRKLTTQLRAKRLKNTQVDKAIKSITNQIINQLNTEMIDRYEPIKPL